MHPELRTLYNLQLADTHVRISTGQMQALDWGEKHAKAIVALRAEAVALAGERTKTAAALQEAEKKLAETESRIQRSSHRIERGEIHNEHELESMEKELEVLRVRHTELEEQVLGLMEEMERFPPRANEIRSQEQRLLKEREQIRQRSTEQKARLEKEIAAVGIRRQDLAAKLSPTLLKRYEQMRDHSSGVAVVRVINGTCDACHVATSPATVREVLESPELVPCQGCGRYLFADAGE